VASPRHVPRPPRSPLGLEPPRAGVARPANTTPRNQTASVAASERAYNNDVSGLGRGDRGVPGCSWPVSLPPARGRRRARRWRILGRGRDWPATSSTFHFLGRRRPRAGGAATGQLPRANKKLRQPIPQWWPPQGTFRGRHVPRSASSLHGLGWRGPRTQRPEIKRRAWRPRNVRTTTTFQGSDAEIVACRAVAGQSRFRRLVADGERGGGESWGGAATGQLLPRRSTSSAAVGHEPAGPRLASYQGRTKNSGSRSLNGGLPKARSEAATFPARPRASTGWGGAAREHNAPKSNGERGGLGTCVQQRRFRARTRRSWRAGL
jgi:hypothetical protein